MNVPHLLALALILGAGDGDGLGTPPVPKKTLPEAVAPAAATGQPDGIATDPPPGPTTPGEIKLVFAYGSEKKGWIDEVTRSFNEARHAVADGRTIRVEPVPMGSGEIIEKLLKPEGSPDQLKAHLVSPASAAFVEIGNGTSIEETGKPLVGETHELVRSPLVLAVWAELAEASRWRAEPPSWSTVFAAVRDPAAWKEATGNRAGIPALKLGHTDPERSNSGLLTLILMVESASRAPRSFEGGLIRSAVRDPAILEAIKATEAHVVQPLNSSTGFLADSMLKGEPATMGAALIYESLVIEKNRGSKDGPRLVAIYPKEGVFANEHPIGVVQRAWVTPAHAEAAGRYVAFLLEKPRQEKAKAHGFRPVDRSIPVDDLLRPEFGVIAGDPASLTSPNSQMIQEIRAVWRSAARPSPR